MQSGTADSIAPRDFWQVLGQRPLGACVVTAQDQNGPKGFLGLSAAHVSAAPPTMLVSIGRGTSALQTVLTAKHFAVSFLPSDAEALSDTFAGKSELKGSERFNPAEWTVIQTGAPVLIAATGAFDCVVTDILERVSEIVVFGLVIGFTLRADAEPLIAFRGGYL